MSLFISEECRCAPKEIRAIGVCYQPLTKFMHRVHTIATNHSAKDISGHCYPGKVVTIFFPSPLVSSRWVHQEVGTQVWTYVPQDGHISRAQMLFGLIHLIEHLSFQTHYPTDPLPYMTCFIPTSLLSFL